MRFLKKLPDLDELKKELVLSSDQRIKRLEIIEELNDILSGRSKKKLLIIGPCSADREDSVLEYMLKLSRVRRRVQDRLCIIPRVYTSKPRTNGKGYKGLVHRPVLDDLNDDIYDGIIAARKMHLSIINETGMFGADEMLYPDAHYYIEDVLAYTSVGARSVEDQQHRLVSSGLSMPVGMKNPTSGDYDVLLNAIYAAQSRQHCILNGYECETDGNMYAHAILRGYNDSTGKMYSNYHFEDIQDLHDLFRKKNLKNVNVIIDCNHGNSRKHYDEQIRIAKEVFSMSQEYEFVNSFVKGIMVESYLEDGSQIIGEGVYGKSITDPCLGWEKTEELIFKLNDMVKN